MSTTAMLRANRRAARRMNPELSDSDSDYEGDVVQKQTITVLRNEDGSFELQDTIEAALVAFAKSIGANAKHLTHEQATLFTSRCSSKILYELEH